MHAAWAAAAFTAGQSYTALPSGMCRMVNTLGIVIIIPRES